MSSGNWQYRYVRLKTGEMVVARVHFYDEKPWGFVRVRGSEVDKGHTHAERHDAINVQEIEANEGPCTPS